MINVTVTTYEIKVHTYNVLGEIKQTCTAKYNIEEYESSILKRAIKYNLN